MIESIGQIGLKIGSEQGLGGQAASAVQGNSSFNAMDFATHLAETLRSGERAAIAGVTGQMPLHETVEKVLQAERTLTAGLAIKDKIVSAYLELTRMQI